MDARVAAEGLVEKVADSRQKILSELRKVIVGQDEVVDEVLMALFCGGHCLITGVPGLAKTLLVKTLAQILDLGVRFGLAVGQRESSRIEDLDFASHGLKKTCRFEDQKPAVRTLTQGSVEQQERWQGSRRDATASRRSVPSSAGRPKVP